MRDGALEVVCWCRGGRRVNQRGRVAMASALSGDGRRMLRLRHGLRDAGALARAGEVTLFSFFATSQQFRETASSTNGRTIRTSRLRIECSRG